MVSENSLIKVEVSNFQKDKIWYEIVNVKAKKVLLGDSHVNEMIDFSGASNHQDGKKQHLTWTILPFSVENDYMYIWDENFRFSTEDDLNKVLVRMFFIYLIFLWMALLKKRK